METGDYGFGASFTAPYDEVMARVKAALKAEGFGVLTEIDVQQTMRDKLGVEMPAYTILGACNPPLAHRALTAEPNIGLMLPCNVVLRAEGAAVRVEIADPVAMLAIAHTPELSDVAQEARQRLERALAALFSIGQAATAE